MTAKMIGDTDHTINEGWYRARHRNAGDQVLQVRIAFCCAIGSLEPTAISEKSLALYAPCHPVPRGQHSCDDQRRVKPRLTVQLR
jgi:hypothetical protein